MDKRPLVSVIIITYNQEKYIKQTVESVLAQQCTFALEIIIGEDCSTDSTRQICIDLQSQYPTTIRLLLNETNKGIVRNYVDTIKEARGKYVADCAGDDFWIDPLKLQKQVDVLEKNTDVILVHTNWKDLDEETGTVLDDGRRKKESFKENPVDKNYSIKLLNQYAGPIFHLCTSCFRTEDVKKIFSQYSSYFDGTYWCEDYQLTFLLLQQGKFYYIPDETLMYRLRLNSACNTADLKKASAFLFNTLLLRLRLAEDFGYKITDIKPYLDHISFSLYATAFKTEDKDLSEKLCSLLKKQGYKPSVKSLVLYGITTNSILRKPLRLLYSSLRKLKLQL